MQNNVLEIWVADDRERNDKSQPEFSHSRKDEQWRAYFA
jgi:hypothetical protein